MTASLLTARRLTVSHGRRRVVHNLDLDLFPGVTAVLGPNGAGKTTLLTGLARLGRGDGGSVALGPALSQAEIPSRRPESAIGFMPQHWTFFPGFTAVESVQYTAWLAGMPPAKARTAAKKALAEVDLAEHANVKVSRLSGGQRQRVGLAEALVNDARVVLLDEPTVGLDPQQRAQFRSLLTARAARAAIVLSTHLTEDVTAIADRVIVFAEGRLRFDGTPEQLAGSAPDGPSGASRLENGYVAVLQANEVLQ